MIFIEFERLFKITIFLVTASFTSQKGDFFFTELDNYLILLLLFKHYKDSKLLWKGIYIKNHFWLLILCHSRVLLRESLEVRSEASLTLYSLAGHHLSCPWLQ